MTEEKKGAEVGGIEIKGSGSIEKLGDHTLIEVGAAGRESVSNGGAVFRPGKILEVMSKLREDIGAIAKTEHASGGQLNFNYRSIEKVMQALSPLLSKHGITTATDISESGHSLQRYDRVTKNATKTACHAKVTCRMYWIADDGSFVTSCGAGEGIDSLSDFASDKAMSYAIKQAIIYGIMIPTANMPDPHGGDTAAENEDSDMVTLAKRMLGDANTAEAIEALGNRFAANKKGTFTADEVKLLSMMCQTKLDNINA